MFGGKELLFSIEVIVEPDGDEFHAYAPDLKGLHTCGRTEDEALENAKNAVIGYLCSLIKHQDPIPKEIVVSRRRKTEVYTRTNQRTENVEYAMA